MKVMIVNQDRVADIAAGYGVDGMGIESRWWRTPPDRTWDPPSLMYNGNGSLSTGLKRPGRNIDSLSHLASKLKKE
jgi:hypothetical protein